MRLHVGRACGHDRRCGPERADGLRGGLAHVHDAVETPFLEGNGGRLSQAPGPAVPLDLAADARVAAERDLDVSAESTLRVVAQRNPSCEDVPLARLDRHAARCERERGIEPRDVSVEIGESGHEAVYPGVLDVDVGRVELNPWRVRPGGERRGLPRKERVRDCDPGRVHVDADVGMANRDLLEIEDEVSLSREQRPEQRERRDAARNPLCVDDRAAGWVEDASVYAGYAERVDVAQRDDREGPAEEGSEHQLVHARGDDASNDGTIEIDEQARDRHQAREGHDAEGAGEHRRGAKRDAGRRARARAQKASPIPIDRAMGAPKIVGGSPLTGLDAILFVGGCAAATSLLNPRTWSGWMR